MRRWFGYFWAFDGRLVGWLVGRLAGWLVRFRIVYTFISFCLLTFNLHFIVQLFTSHKYNFKFNLEIG